MHGITLRAIELMVCQNYGEDVWQDMKDLAGIKMPGSVLVTEYYSDSVTYRLVEAAQEIIGIAENVFWEQLGEYFFDYIVEYGYSRLLSVLGETPVDFLENLDTLHCALSRIYPINAPLFRCEKLPNGTYVLHYYSKRSKKMEYYMMGLIKRTLRSLFNTNAEMKFLHKSEQEKRSTFSIRFKKSTGAGTIQESPKPVVEDYFPVLKPAISPATFATLCPFHITMDAQLNIKECGTSILRVMPEILLKSLPLIARFIRPWVPVTPDAIKEHLNSIFLCEFFECEISAGATGKSFKLAGQMLYSEETGVIVFVSSPYITTLDDLQRQGFCLADMALHDAKRDLILASENFALEHQTFQKLEELTQTLQQTTKQIKEEKQKTDKLIYSILPLGVAESLRHGTPVAAQRFESATILFSGIVNFDKFCLSRSEQLGAVEVIHLLNNLYSRYDSLFDGRENPNLYKVETVLDKYMVVSGAPVVLPDQIHADEVAVLALRMMKSLKGITMDDQPIEVTIGIHSGEIVAGVIGQRMPRYCLFGDTVNTASRVMTGGQQGAVNISESTHRILNRYKGISRISYAQMEYLGQVQLKGKRNPMRIWVLRNTIASSAIESLKSRTCEVQ